MWEKHLCQWIRGETWEKERDDTNSRKLGTLAQAAFQGGYLANSCAWQTVVVTPKGGKQVLQSNFSSIGPVEGHHWYH